MWLPTTDTHRTHIGNFGTSAYPIYQLNSEPALAPQEATAEAAPKAPDYDLSDEERKKYIEVVYVYGVGDSRKAEIKDRLRQGETVMQNVKAMLVA